MNAVNNSSRQKGFFAAHGLCPANRAEPRLESFALLRSLIAPRFSKISYALATLKATIILPAFALSCFADGGKEKKFSR